MLFFLESLAVRSRLLINSVGDGQCRPGYIEMLRGELLRKQAELCEDCRRRTETNPLRVLDCKVETCQGVIDSLPKIADNLCAECSRHFEQVKNHLREADIAFEIDPRLVRGLDYYVRTAFEIVSGDLGAQNALVGGGRYDGLAEMLGGPRVPGFGFAMGLDRLVMILPEAVHASGRRRPDLYIAYMGDACFRNALAVARELRHKGFTCHVEFTGGSLKSQMRQANRAGARNVLLVGEEELARGRFLLKRMDDSTQREVALEALLEHLAGHADAGG